MKRIGVGFIGAVTDDQDGSVAAHLSALRSVPEFELRAVSASSRHDDLHDLIVRPGIDLVVVAAGTIDHHASIAAALHAGKTVFSDWPLGGDLEEAEDLAARAQVAGVRTCIGLPARYAPAVHHARDLVRRGFVGDVRATTLVGSAMDARPSVAMLHALDALTHVLGGFESVSATAATLGPTMTIADGERSPPLEASDRIAMSGHLRSGAIASTFYRGGMSRGGNFRWEINGTDGDLVLSASNGNVQFADLSLQGGCGDDESLASLDIPPSFIRSGAGQTGELGANVLRQYAALAHDLRHGTYLVPDFDDALSRHRLLASIERAAGTGMGQKTF
jgi:predicted dehydrogenase